VPLKGELRSPSLCFFSLVLWLFVEDSVTGCGNPFSFRCVALFNFLFANQVKFQIIGVFKSPFRGLGYAY